MGRLGLTAHSRLRVGREAFYRAASLLSTAICVVLLVVLQARHVMGDHGLPALLVLNKCDLVAASCVERWRHFFERRYPGIKVRSVCVCDDVVSELGWNTRQREGVSEGGDMDEQGNRTRRTENTQRPGPRECFQRGAGERPL